MVASEPLRSLRTNVASPRTPSILLNQRVTSAPADHPVRQSRLDPRFAVPDAPPNIPLTVHRAPPDSVFICATADPATPKPTNASGRPRIPTTPVHVATSFPSFSAAASMVDTRVRATQL